MKKLLNKCFDIYCTLTCLLEAMYFLYTVIANVPFDFEVFNNIINYTFYAIAIITCIIYIVDKVSENSND